MILTSNYGLKKPEGADLINVEDFNANADMLDEKLAAVEAEMADVKKSVSDGDIAENIITFESRDAAEANVWTDVDVLVSGEKHKSILKKVSTMFKNVRYLYKMLGTTDISAIGAGTVTGAIASQNEALASKVNSNDFRLSDARTPTTHTHDDRYYTEAEINSLFASKIVSGINRPDDYGTWHLQTIPTGGKMITGETKTYSFSFGSSYGNLYYTEFDIVLPVFLSTIRNAFIQVNAVNGLIGAVITSKTASHVKGFMYSSDNTSHQISLSIIAYGS